MNENNNPRFIHVKDVIGMTQLMARYSEKGLDSKKKNPETDVTKFANVDQVFDMLVDNGEIEILRELLTPNEFELCWTSYYMFITNSSMCCQDIDKEVLPRIKHLLSVRKNVMEGRKIED